uniref:Uncharacterized protein n=1 Tax=Anguilla anguilla TaxID=7936 RepID=A0A0E9X9B1_ANGAN
MYMCMHVCTYMCIHTYACTHNFSSRVNFSMNLQLNVFMVERRDYIKEK